MTTVTEPTATVRDHLGGIALDVLIPKRPNKADGTQDDAAAVAIWHQLAAIGGYEAAPGTVYVLVDHEREPETVPEGSLLVCAWVENPPVHP